MSRISPEVQQLQAQLASLQDQLHKTQLAYHMAVELAQFKAGFLSRVAHELRSPLNSILGTHQLILSDLCNDPAEEREFLAMAHQSTLTMITLLDDILNVAKLEQGRQQLDMQSLPLTGVLTEVYQATALIARDRNRPLQLSLPEAAIAVWADQRWLRQVLLNLVSDALAIQAEGAIHLSAQASPATSCAYIWLADQRPASAWSEWVDTLRSPLPVPDNADPRLSSGLTLLINQIILEQMQGQLEIVPVAATDWLDGLVQDSVDLPTPCIQCSVPLAPKPEH
jgi:hypothetical protein